MEYSEEDKARDLARGRIKVFDGAVTLPSGEVAHQVSYQDLLPEEMHRQGKEYVQLRREMQAAGCDV